MPASRLSDLHDARSGNSTLSKSAAEIAPVTRTLAAYIADARMRALPEDVAETTKHHVLDSLAAMASGSQLLPGLMALAYAQARGGSDESTIVGSRCVTNAVNAAMA